VTLHSLPLRTATLTVIATAFVAIFLVIAPAAMAQTPAGSISAVTGTVNVQRASRTIPGTYGMAIMVGDRIITGANGRVTVTLADQSQLEVTESSTLVVDQNTVSPTGTRVSTKVTLFGGLVRSIVSPTATPPNFEIHTPNAVASARGSAADVGYQNGVARDKFKDCLEFTDVSVYKGKWEVTNPTNPGAPPVEVDEGQKTTVACALAPLPATSITAAGIGTGTIVAALLIGGGGATLLGLGLSGEFGGGNSHHHNPPPKPKSPSD
jgi:ferric-dicitrate binding protein FerR (iron transport regulator)